MVWYVAIDLFVLNWYIYVL